MSNELQIKENVLDNGSQTLVSSFKMDSMEDRLKVLKATNTPDHRIKDFVNMEITIKDIYIETVNVLQDEKDENGKDIYQTCPRTIIVDDKGESYVAVSFGVFTAVKRIVELLAIPMTGKNRLNLK